MSEAGALVVLVGAPGAGKSRAGKRLAKLLGVPLVDTDARVVAEHGAIAQIFAEHGEGHFRRLEREAVARALREPAVVVLGGGAVLDETTQADLASLPVVQLTTSAEAVLDRIAGGKRPLLAGGGIDAWIALVTARQPIYDRVSDFTIDTSAQSIDDVARQAAHWLQLRNS